MPPNVSNYNRLKNGTAVWNKPRFSILIACLVRIRIMWKMYVKRCGVTGISWIGLERGTLTRPSLRVPNVPFGLHISFYSLLQCKVAAKMWFRLLQAAKMDWLYQIALLISFPDRMQLVRERRKRSYGWQQPM